MIQLNENTSFPTRGFKKISEKKLEESVFGVDYNDFFLDVVSKWEALTEREISLIKDIIKSKTSSEYTYEYKFSILGDFDDNVGMSREDKEKVPNFSLNVYCYMVSLDRKYYIDANGYKQYFDEDDLPYSTTPENMTPYVALIVYKMKDSWYYIDSDGSDERYVCDQYDGFRKCLKHIEADIIKYM